MKAIVEATFDGEVFRPKEPVSLEPQTVVRLTVEPLQPYRWLPPAQPNGRTLASGESPSAIGEVLTAGEMKARFPAEFFFLGEPEFNQRMELQRGRILWHSPSQQEAYQQAIQLTKGKAPGFFAYHFTGDMPDDILFAL